MLSSSDRKRLGQGSASEEVPRKNKKTRKPKKHKVKRDQDCDDIINTDTTTNIRQPGVDASKEQHGPLPLVHTGVGVPQHQQVKSLGSFPDGRNRKQGVKGQGQSSGSNSDADGSASEQGGDAGQGHGDDAQGDWVHNVAAVAELTPQGNPLSGSQDQEEQDTDSDVEDARIDWHSAVQCLADMQVGGRNECTKDIYDHAASGLMKKSDDYIHLKARRQKEKRENELERQRLQDNAATQEIEVQRLRMEEVELHMRRFGEIRSTNKEMAARVRASKIPNSPAASSDAGGSASSIAKHVLKKDKNAAGRVPLVNTILNAAGAVSEQCKKFTSDKGRVPLPKSRKDSRSSSSASNVAVSDAAGQGVASPAAPDRIVTMSTAKAANAVSWFSPMPALSFPQRERLMRRMVEEKAANTPLEGCVQRADLQ